MARSLHKRDVIVLPQLRPKSVIRSALACILLGLAFFAVVPGLGGTTPAANRIYSWQRSLRQRSLVAAFEGRATAESVHFVLYYDEVRDGSWAVATLESAEAARESALARLGSTPLSLSVSGVDPGRTTILLYPDYASLDRQFGSRTGFQAIGAYWGGVIQLLSPRLWLDAQAPSDAEARLAIKGPVVHEYTHYLLDRIVPGGNYPRWLSEGLAQYVEYQETGYLWLEPGNRLWRPVRPESLYSLADLTDFDSLENTALAYRQAFLLVSYLAESRGDGVGRLLGRLGRGDSFGAALERVTGLRATDWERSWIRWLDLNLERYPGHSGKEANPS